MMEVGDFCLKTNGDKNLIEMMKPSAVKMSRVSLSKILIRFKGRSPLAGGGLLPTGWGDAEQSEAEGTAPVRWGQLQGC